MSGEPTGQGICKKYQGEDNCQHKDDQIACRKGTEIDEVVAYVQHNGHDAKACGDVACPDAG